MESDNQNNIWCADDNEYRIYCNLCDRLCINRFYNNHLKSGTHNNNINKTQQLDSTNK